MDLKDRRSELHEMYRRLYAGTEDGQPDYAAAPKRHPWTSGTLYPIALRANRGVRGGRWLDVGSGGYDLAEQAREVGMELTRTDPGHPAGDDTPIEDLEEAYGPESFDMVTSFDVLEHLLPEDLDESIRNLWAVLKPPGLAAVSIGAHRSVRKGPDGQALHLTVMRPEEWRKKLEEVTGSEWELVDTLNGRTPFFVSSKGTP